MLITERKQIASTYFNEVDHPALQKQLLSPDFHDMAPPHINTF